MKMYSLPCSFLVLTSGPSYMVYRHNDNYCILKISANYSELHILSKSFK